MLILNTDVPLPTITTATMSLQFPMHTNSEPTLDIEGANLQNQGVCGVLTGVVTHVMNTYLEYYCPPTHHNHHHNYYWPSIPDTHRLVSTN